MKLIGLTGGIGSGKSTVGRLLADAGALVIDADVIAREVVEPGQPALEEIRARFGADVLQDDGSLDRAALAAIVFAADEARADLEAITHPRIAAAIADRIDQQLRDEAAGAPSRLVVLEHPLLVEAGLAPGHDVVVVVEAPAETRVARLVERGMTGQDARARMAAQASDEERRSAATHVLDNAGTPPDLARQVEALLEELGAG